MTPPPCSVATTALAGRQSGRPESMLHQPAFALFIGAALVTTLVLAEPPNNHRIDVQRMETGFTKTVEASVRLLTEADCVDSSDGYYGYDCATILAVGYCPSYMCPTCSGAGLCDVSCGYCSTTEPTTEPTASPSATEADCVDSDDGYYGYDCATILAVGYCPSHMCPTCSGAGLCDVSCGYCSTSVVSTASPTLSPAPPTMTNGSYYVSTFSAMHDAVAAAEDDHECVIHLTGDISATCSIEILSGKNVKVLGSRASDYDDGRRALLSGGHGRRTRVTPEPTYYSDCNAFLCTSVDSSSVALWLEDIEFSDFTNGAESGGRKWYVFRLEALNSSTTLINCRFANNWNVLRLGYGATDLTTQGFGTKAYREAGHLFVNGSQFVDNRATGQGAAISAMHGATLTITNTLFARNAARAELGAGGAIFVYLGSTTTISNCSFRDNYARLEAGAVGTSTAQATSDMRGKLTIQNSVFWNNTANGKGGAILNADTFALRITNTEFADNVALGGDGGAVAINPDCAVTIATSSFERNRALSGSGGAIFSSSSSIDLLDSNFTGNNAVDGGAVRATDGAALYPRGETRFENNNALRSGGAISLDASSLKTNTAALVFVENSARLGGALSVENEAHVLMQAGCQTSTFAMQFASSEPTAFAAPSVIVRAINKNANEKVRPATDMIDELGEWTMLFPLRAEDANISFCLAAGVYEIVASGGGTCDEGWGGGFLRVMDLADSELLAPFTLVGVRSRVYDEAGEDAEKGLCVVVANMTIVEDSALSGYGGSILFDHNHATGTLDGTFCGTGCGGALFVGEDSSADLGRIEFANNSAVDGGALYVDVLADLSLTHVAMLGNTAARYGGAVSAGNLATVSVRQSVARNNAAGQSGGMLHLSSVEAATLLGVDATGNSAGVTGGAVAAVDSTRSRITLTNSTIRRNAAGDSGGGLSLTGSAVDIAGVGFHANLAERGNGGAVSTSGTDATVQVKFPGTKCANIDVLLDWTAVHKCEGDTMFNFVCEAWMLYWGGGITCADVPAKVAGSISCEGCPCNFGCEKMYLKHTANEQPIL